MVVVAVVLVSVAGAACSTDPIGVPSPAGFTVSEGEGFQPGCGPWVLDADPSVDDEYGALLRWVEEVTDEVTVRSPPEPDALASARDGRLDGGISGLIDPRGGQDVRFVIVEFDGEVTTVSRCPM